MALFNESLLDIPRGEVSDHFEEVPNAADEELGDVYKGRLLTEVHLTADDFIVRIPQRCSFKLLFIRRDNYVRLRRMLRETIPLCIVGRMPMPFVNVQEDTKKKLEILFTDNYWIIPLRRTRTGFRFEGVRLPRRRTVWMIQNSASSFYLIDAFVAGYSIKKDDIHFSVDLDAAVVSSKSLLSTTTPVFYERLNDFTKDLSHELAALEDVR